jgi:hypothetical protein
MMAILGHVTIHTLPPAGLTRLGEQATLPILARGIWKL